MRLLVTGASGFLGANLVDRLLGTTSPDGPIELHVLARSRSKRFASDAAVSVTEHTATQHTVTEHTVTEHTVDLARSDEMSRAVADIGASHLCHLAWLGPEHANRYHSEANRNWVGISRRLFEAFVDGGGQRLVHVGSCIEYGNDVEGPRSESLPLAPDTAYGEAKAEVAQFLDDDFAESVSAAVARPFFCYGPHEQPQRLVPSIVRALHNGDPVDLTEGRQRRDYLDGRDAADALIALLRSNGTGPFNIGSGQAVEVRSVALTIGSLLARRDLLRFGARPDGADSAAEITADIRRITSATGWSPTVSLEDGLAHAIAWWAEHAVDQRPS